MDKFTLLPLCLLDGTDISAARTASYATLVLERLLAPRRDASVFLFGAGPIAEKIILALDRCHGENIREVLVRSRTGDSAIRLARSLGETVTFDIVPVRDNLDLGRCDFVITASNAKAPVFEAGEIGDAAVLHLGGDETPRHIWNGRCGAVVFFATTWRWCRVVVRKASRFTSHEKVRRWSNRDPCSASGQ